MIRNRTDNLTSSNLDTDPKNGSSLSVKNESIGEPRTSSENEKLIHANRDSSFEIVQTLKKIEEHLAFLRGNQQAYTSDWLTIPEAALELKVSEDTIQRLVAYGKLKAAEIETPMGKGQKKRYRIHRDWIKDFMFCNVKQVCAETISITRSTRKFKPPIEFIK